MLIFLKKLKSIFVKHRYYLLVSAIIYFLGNIIGILISYKTKLLIHPKSLLFLPTVGHNYFVGIKIILGGVFTVGILNSIYIACNGLMLGSTLIGVYNSYGVTPIVTGILPHAITEILAMLVCCTVGFESLRFVNILKRNYKLEIQEKVHIKDSFILIAVAFILFFVSAIIETKFAYVQI